MKLVFKSFVVALAILSSVFLVSGLDAEDKREPITIVSHVDIKPDAYMPQAEENSWRLFRAETAATKQDAGLVSYVVLQQIDATNHFTIVETWRDAKAYEMHVECKHTYSSGMRSNRFWAVRSTPASTISFARGE